MDRPHDASDCLHVPRRRPPLLRVLHVYPGLLAEPLRVLDPDLARYHAHLRGALCVGRVLRDPRSTGGRLGVCGTRLFRAGLIYGRRVIGGRVELLGTGVLLVGDVDTFCALEIRTGEPEPEEECVLYRVLVCGVPVLLLRADSVGGLLDGVLLVGDQPVLDGKAEQSRAGLVRVVRQGGECLHERAERVVV